MTPYELDSTDDRTGSNNTDDRTESNVSTDRAESSLGVSIPEDHVGAFVAETLEDPECSTTWDDVVDAIVAPDARAAWRDLSPVEQATVVLSKASEYDQRAIEHFDSVALEDDQPAVQSDLDEGLRCRRNADVFRNGVAAAYGDGLLDDTDIVAALAAADFETGHVAEREDLLERIDSVYDVEYRPYGGTLLDTDDGPEPDPDHEETW